MDKKHARSGKEQLSLTDQNPIPETGLEKTTSQLPVVDQLSSLERLQPVEAFQSRLNRTGPPKEDIKINDKANNSEYLPISFVQMTLDEEFFGLWQTRNFRTAVVANEVTGEIELSVFHPVAQIWLTRTGSGAVPIQMRSVEKGGDGDITNVRNKIANTLVKDYPHLMAECMKSAAKTLGVKFGRDLNRKFTDTYSPVIPELEKIGFRNTEIELLLETKQIDLNYRQTLTANLPHMDAKRMLQALEFLRKQPNKSDGEI